MPIAIEDVVKHIRDLPSLPAVVIELLSTMEQEDVDIHALGARIALDQSLTAKTLRLANSSFYGVQSKVTSIPQAISVLGFRSIRTLVTACAVTGSFPASACAGFHFQAFWRHSVATGVCAQLLARRLKVNPDSAFTAGLLHDIGALVLATRFPPQYAQMLAYRAQHDCSVVAAEQAIFGLDHALVGSTLAGYWKFPLAMQSAVAGHHRDGDAADAPLDLVVQAANTLAHALDLSEVEDDLVPALSPHVWQLLALSEADSLALFQEAETTFHEMCQVLIT
ncbi:MAG: HDOD domain-containing protein [Pseudomonadota bacterium]|nr:HDOD domain-containing protein [Pseudomonadota bacterium]